MVVELMLIALILVLCIIADKFSGKFGMPALILFIGIGMLFGSDGIVKIPFDNFAVTEQICTIALGFIMFYGGFNTKWKAAKPVAVKSLLLSTAGVFLTGFLTMAFCCSQRVSFWERSFPVRMLRVYFPFYERKS